jgi:ABC-2 type transport system permease protein
VNASRQVYLVAARDFRERVTSRAFQISTVLTVLLIGGFILLPSILGVDDAPTWDVGSVGPAPEGLEIALETAAANPDTKVTIAGLGSRSELEDAIRDGTYDAGIDGNEIVEGPDASDELIALLVAVSGSLEIADRAGELGLSQEELTTLLGGSASVVPVDPEDGASGSASNDEDRVLAFFGVIFLFISIVTYGQWILIGVIEEKSSRVVEVVLGAVRPHRLLAGKVLGIGALGLAQLILVGAVAFVLIQQASSFDIPDAAGITAVSLVVWFLLGFAFYATAYAATGSLVSRQEEAQNAAFPLTMVLMAAYFIASFSFTGDNPVLRVASLLPPTAPMTMPLRMAAGDAAGWEVALSLTLMVLTTYLLVRLAGRIYAGGLLRSGPRIKLKDAWRSSEA